MSLVIKKEGFFVFFACAAVLFFAHPSFQLIYSAYEIPSSLVFIVLLLPSLFLALTFNVELRGHVKILTSFAVYISWMLIRAVDSPAAGNDNYYASLLGVGVLLPLSLLCALIAAKQPRLSLVIVTWSGAIALIHYFYIMIFGSGFDFSGGFTSLSNDHENQNYQFTSFYFGLIGVWFAVAAMKSVGFKFITYSLGFVIVLVSMSLVGARSSIVALAASALLIFAFKSSGRSKATVLYGAVAIILIFGLSIYIGSGDVSSISEKFVVFDRFSSLAESDDSSQRIRLFTSAIEMWGENWINFFIGGGLAAFPFFLGEASVGWYPHNFILETLAEGGSFGGLALLVIGAHLFVRWRSVKFEGDGASIVTLGALAVYSVTAYQFMGGIQSIWIPTFFVGLFLFSKKKV